MPRYKHNEQYHEYRSSHYSLNHPIASGNVNLTTPKLKGLVFETAIIKLSRSRGSRVEDAPLTEMYTARVLFRCVETITEAL